jgi:hypothetical protein
VTRPTPQALIRWLLALLLLMQGGAVSGVALDGSPQKGSVAGYDERADLSRPSRPDEPGRFLETGAGEEKRDAVVSGASALLPALASLLLPVSRDAAFARQREGAGPAIPDSFQARAPPASV